MDSINTSSPSTNPQLSGIVRTLPMPNRDGATADGTPFSFSPDGTFSLGGSTGAGYSITNGQIVPQPLSSNAAPGVGTIAVGGGGTPADGAQPPAPGSLTAAGTNGTPPTTVPTAANATTTPADAAATGETMNASGFGRADKNAPMRVDVGGAAFSFPSFNSTAKTTTAPDISWDPSWKRVEKNGMWYMEAPNGTKAIPAVEYRITPTPAEKVQTVKVANGWGKKFPDGTILVFDRNEGAYRLDAKGNKRKVELGTYTFGGVKVRVFEASVVRTLTPKGQVEVFDSRGNASRGSSRSRLAAALGAADAGASMGGGGKTDSGPSTESGGGKGKVDGTLVNGGGGGRTAAQLTGDVQHLTEVARGILSEVRSGNVDPARLASLQAQLNALPSGILQAAGAAGTMTGSSPVSTTSASTVGNDQAGAPPGSTLGGGGSATGTPPVAGVDANSTSKQLAAGSKAKLGTAISAEFNGRKARFGQLPADVQEAVARAFGSDQGAAAFKADQLVSFNASGEVTLVEAGTVYLRHQAQVRGAGPGEDMALTVRPGRQPGASAARTTGAASGGGGASMTDVTGLPTTSTSSTRGPGSASSSTGVVTVGGGATNTGSRLELFRPGAEIRSVDFGGVNGSFTWKTLPAKAKQALVAWFASNPTDPAARAFNSRTGSGWSFDPSAVIVMEAGYAQFVGGMSLVRAASTAPVSGGGASNQTIGHDATRPPVSGGGASGLGSVPPGTAPPRPLVNDPGEGSGQRMNMDM